jgi:hypothetical protein
MLYSQRPAVLSLRALCGIVPVNVGSFSGSEVWSVPFTEAPLVSIWSNVGWDSPKLQMKGEEGDSQWLTGSHLPKPFSGSSLSDAEALEVIRG